MTSPQPAAPYACPSCGEPVWPADNFCESCRADLSPILVSGEDERAPADCPVCPGAPATPDGYCESCGRKLASGADHAELALGLVAGVTDRGLRHPGNEDAMALGVTRKQAGSAAIAVVCDGVSTSARSGEAARTAAGTAARELLAALRSGDDPSAASCAAFTAAKDAVISMPPGGDARDAPSATYVSAVVTGEDVTVCWIGDSRAYWLDATSTAAEQLTTDDSMAQELVTSGLATAAQALASPAGHVITGWLGADLKEAEPHLVVFTPSGPGAVLLCTDGLWNYQSAAAGLAGHALPAALSDPLGAASALVRFAISAGGGDNVTAVLAPFPPGGVMVPADREGNDEPS